MREREKRENSIEIEEVKDPGGQVVLMGDLCLPGSVHFDWWVNCPGSRSSFKPRCNISVDLTVRK